MLSRRRWFVPLYALMWVGLLAGFVAILSNPSH
jgi:hypothetical protein